MISRPVLRDAEDGADTAVWLVATRPESEPPHFWHDRAQRPVDVRLAVASRTALTCAGSWPTSRRSPGPIPW